MYFLKLIEAVFKIYSEHIASLSDFGGGMFCFFVCFPLRGLEKRREPFLDHQEENAKDRC